MTPYNHWQARLNWCLTLHAHKERTDALSMTSTVNEFVSRNQYIRKIRGLIDKCLENLKAERLTR